MDLCSWRKRQYQNVGPPSQATGTHQIITGTTGNQQAHLSYTNAQISPSTYFTYQDGGYSNRQMSHWQPSQSHHQALSFQQPAGGGTNKYLNVSNGNVHNLLTNSQSGNTLVNHGHPVATQQDFHPNSRFVCSSIQSPPNKKTENSTYSQQSMFPVSEYHTANRKKSPRPQNGKTPPESFQLLRRLLTDVDGGSVVLNALYPSKAISLPQGQVGGTNRVMSVPACNRQTVHQGLSRSTQPPSYDMAVSQLFRKETITTMSSSNGHISNMGQTAQENPYRLNPTHANMEEATCRSLSKANQHSTNPGAHTEEDMFRNEKISRIVEDLHTSFIRKSDQKQPVPLTFTDSYNLNASQSLAHNSRQSLCHTTPSVMSGTQHIQQKPKPNVPYVTARGDGYGWAVSNGNGNRAANIFTIGSNRVSDQNLTGSLNNASKVIHHHPENITQQRNQAGLSSVNNHEILEHIPPSPGRMGMRAVAVVQPLQPSQVSYHGISKNTSSSPTNKPAEHTTISETLCSFGDVSVPPVVEKKNEAESEESEFYPESLNLNHLSSSSDGCQDLSKKKLCVDDAGSEVAVDLGIRPTAQQSVTSEVPVCQSEDENKSDDPTDAKTDVLELSLIPTILWTYGMLHKFTEVKEKQQAATTDCNTSGPGCDLTKILDMFWEGSIAKLAYSVQRGLHHNITNCEFLKKHVDSNTVILSQVKYNFSEKLKNYHVLQENEVYSELPYKSSWLNVNEQLDDIDKDFGFPWSLKYQSHLQESPSQPDKDEILNSLLAEKVQEKVLSEPEGDKTSTAETTSTQAVFPDETESTDSHDSIYSFEIKVLPPEDAKQIFEEIQCKMPQNADMDSEPGLKLKSSLEDGPPEVMDVSHNERKQETVCPIEEVCCLPRWIEIINGLKTPSGTCQCKVKQSLADCTDKTLDKPEIAVQRVDDQAKAKENSDSLLVTCSKIDPCSESIQNMGLTENGQVCSDKMPKNIFQMSENEFSTSDSEFQSESEEDGIQENVQSCTLVWSDEEIKGLTSCVSEIARPVSGIEEDCGQASHIFLYDSSTETKEKQPEIGMTTTSQPASSLCSKPENTQKKRRRQSSSDECFSRPHKLNKCKPSEPSTCGKVGINDRPSTSKFGAVQLVLYGSALQKNGGLSMSRRQTRSLSAAALCDGQPKPANVLSVSLSPPKQTSSQPEWSHSAKQLIHKKWRESFIPTVCRRKGQKSTFSSSVTRTGVILKRTERLPCTNTTLPVSSADFKRNRQSVDVHNWNTNAKRCLNMKRKRSLSMKFKRKKKAKMDIVTLAQPADQADSTTENGSHADIPLSEDHVLKFSVLPLSFSFHDGSNKRMETCDPAENEDEDRSSGKTISSSRGTWHPKPEKVYRPLDTPLVSNTSKIFQEFQKKYKVKTPPSTDQ